MIAHWLTDHYLLTAPETLLVVGTAFVAGVMRGFSGFGAALTIAPVLSLVVGPRAGIPAILIMMMVTSFQLVPGALRHAKWRTVAPLSVGGVIGVPLGSWLLIVVNQDIMRRSISAIVIFFALLMMIGWRYRGEVGSMISGLAGAIGGFISGAAAAGGPPVVMFLLAGPESAASNRASIILYFVFMQAMAIAAYSVGGLMTLKTLWIAVPMIPTLALGTWLGERMFGKASDNVYRRIALVFLLAIGLSTFFA